MSGLAYVFPGQGSQSVGMLVAKSAEALSTFKEASEAIGYDMEELISSGPAELLNQTEYTQPALLTVSVACMTYLQLLYFVFAKVSIADCVVVARVVAAVSSVLTPLIRMAPST